MNIKSRAPVRRVRPLEFKGYIANPHRGCCTFQHFNGDPLYPGSVWSEVGPTAFGPKPRESVVDGYLPATVAYCRWYWEVLEPDEGQYDFSMIEGAMRCCAERGQTLAVRLMPMGHKVNPLPSWYIAKYPTVVENPRASGHVVPDYDAPRYLEHFGGLIQAFAARFRHHPLLESVDMAYLGPWGEGNGVCGEAQVERFVRMYEEALPDVPRLALCGGAQMRAAVARGAGWRCDCYGDLRPRNSDDVALHNGWNHMYGAYPQEVFGCGATDTWRTAPVHLESCSVPREWYRHEIDIDFVLQQGLKYHATYFMPKYTRLPAPWIEKLADFCNHLGYRFVYRQAEYPQWTSVDGAIDFASWIENVGVAPLYRDCAFALRFRQDSREEIVVLNDLDVRNWLPGDVLIEQRVALPKRLRPGWLQLAAGLVRRHSPTPFISFATTAELRDRWVDLGGLELRPQTD